MHVGLVEGLAMEPRLCLGKEREKKKREDKKNCEELWQRVLEQLPHAVGSESNTERKKCGFHCFPKTCSGDSGGLFER